MQLKKKNLPSREQSVGSVQKPAGSGHDREKEMAACSNKKAVECSTLIRAMSRYVHSLDKPSWQQQLNVTCSSEVWVSDSLTQSHFSNPEKCQLSCSGGPFNCRCSCGGSTPQHRFTHTTPFCNICLQLPLCLPGLFLLYSHSLTIAYGPCSLTSALLWGNSTISLQLPKGSEPLY